MGTMTFLLPPGLSPEAARELERACIAGGPDSFPLPTRVHVESGLLTLQRQTDESGSLVVPWDIQGAGRLMGSTATLIERDLPYHFQVELARGKINQLRCQAADWQSSGLQLSPELDGQIHQALLDFCKAVTQPPGLLAGGQAQTALERGYQAADQLVWTYIEQMLRARHQRQPRFDTRLGCRVGPAMLADDQARELVTACNSICLPFAWNEIEPVESSYHWEPYDALLDWAKAQGLAVTAGPLIDFTPARLPDWLWLWEKDPAGLATFMCEYVATAVKRYADRIPSWHLTAASNYASILSLGEEELWWLTARLAQVAREVHPKIELFIGISQPWGEYMAVEDRTYSPYYFADSLIRSGINVSALDLELVMGVTPRGSYCRDLLETSRLIDVYSLLGVPLRLTLGYPSSGAADANADPDYQVSAGHWHDDFSPEFQANWTSAFTSLALCKPSVRAIHWTHFSDAEPHPFPHAGLADATGKPKPALGKFRQLRQSHLR